MGLSHGAHHHGHGHHHHAPTHFDRAFKVGIALNFAFVLIEVFFGWQGNSLSLLADAGHNLSDVAGLVLAWVALLFSRRPTTEHLTYGWRRGPILASFLNAVALLIAMGSLGWEAIGRFQEPQAFSGTTVIWVAAAGVLVNGLTAALFFSGSHDDLNIRGAFLHMAADALVSLGVMVSGGLYLWKGWSWIDPLATVVIAVVIVWGTWSLFRQSVHLLFDGVPTQVDVAGLRHYLAELPEVRDVHDLHVWALSTTEIALSAHLTLHQLPHDDHFLRAVTKVLHDRFGIEHSTVQFEQELGCHTRCAEHRHHDHKKARHS